MAYQAWVTNAQTVLRQQQQEQERQEQTGQLPTGASGRVQGGGGARRAARADHHPCAQEVARARRQSWRMAQTRQWQRVRAPRGWGLRAGGLLLAASAASRLLPAPQAAAT